VSRRPLWAGERASFKAEPTGVGIGRALSVGSADIVGDVPPHAAVRGTTKAIAITILCRILAPKTQSLQLPGSVR
jgi:hypothetical protein